MMMKVTWLMQSGCHLVTSNVFAYCVNCVIINILKLLIILLNYYYLLFFPCKKMQRTSVQSGWQHYEKILVKMQMIAEWYLSDGLNYESKMSSQFLNSLCVWNKSIAIYVHACNYILQTFILNHFLLSVLASQSPMSKSLCYAFCAHYGNVSQLWYMGLAIIVDMSFS